MRLQLAEFRRVQIIEAIREACLKQPRSNRVKMAKLTVALSAYPKVSRAPMLLKAIGIRSLGSS